MGRRLAATVGAALISMLFGAVAHAQPTAPLSHSGRWITDASGRVVILHGLNMVYKVPPYAPSAGGFGADDAQFLEDNGFNTVRLGLIYKAIEPTPGIYDDAYLNDIASTEQTLAAHGVFSLLDFHQDLFNERFQGEGWPDWSVQDDGLPALPQLGFPANYLAMPALWRAFDHFWANDPGPGGVGIQDRYDAAWHHVAARFASAQHTVGYDTLNEPWPGTVWPTCAVPLVGCPLFDTGQLAAFASKVDTAIRSSDPQKLVWNEPNVTFDFGVPTSLPSDGDPQSGLSFHDYCLPGGLGIPGFPASACDALEQQVFTNADAHAQQTSDALLLTEFGATDDADALNRILADADSHMVGWQEWQYCGCSDPTTQAGPGSTEALVIDPEKPPSGDNVKQQKLAVLSRPYPQAVAGTPKSYSYDTSANRFSLDYSTARAGGGGFTPGAQTEVFVPPVHYPSGYDVDVQGAAIASAPGARLLRVAACPGAATVSVAVSPPGAGAGDGPDCTLPASAVAAGRIGCRRKRLKLKGKKAKRAKHKRRLRAAGC
jgi:endoglycosylceramidase